jgi:hypothetical protein
LNPVTTLRPLIFIANISIESDFVVRWKWIEAARPQVEVYFGRLTPVSSSKKHRCKGRNVLRQE